MSAFLVSDTHIDVLTRAAIKYKVVPRRAADLLGQELKRVNQYAVAVRYGEDVAANVDIVGTYARTPFERRVFRAVNDAAIRCWIYQCSEFEGFTETQAYCLMLEVRKRNAWAHARHDYGYAEELCNENGWDALPYNRPDDFDVPAIEWNNPRTDEDTTHVWHIGDEDRDAVQIETREERRERRRAEVAARIAREAEERQARIEAAGGELEEDGLIHEDDSDESDWEEDDDEPADDDEL